MIAESILAFFLLRHIRKILRATYAPAEWGKPLSYAMIGVAVLFFISVIFKGQSITAWVLHAFLLAIVVVTFKRKEFYPVRNTILAVLPLIVVFILSDFIKLLPYKIYRIVEKYPDFAFPFSVIWMVAMLIISKKQQKALEKERKKTHEEEEQNRLMTARKAELEILVTERTSEIQKQKDELEHALNELRTTQVQLIQSEKMASLGQLTAGIAHEIQNPLNFVNNFSEVNAELIEELQHEASNGNMDEVKSIAINIKENEQKINHHGKRADAIVKGMLQHSRATTSQREPTDINALADEYLRLSFHGIRAKDKAFNATLQTNFDKSLGKINIISQDIGRVMLNLCNNAFYAVTEKKKNPHPLNGAPEYEPTVSVTTKSFKFPSGGLGVSISVKDNGNGIPQEVKDKIFQPFFTTKPTGQGTGLGLSLTYDIIKAHSGEIKVETKEGEGSEFEIQLPIV